MGIARWLRRGTPGRRDPLAGARHVVVLGGGTGMSTALRGLKGRGLRITAIVSMADDGGSSGVLRERLGIPPVGDLRNCLIALADAEPTAGVVLQHRLPTEAGSTRGHPIGNLLLAAAIAVAAANTAPAVASAPTPVVTAAPVAAERRAPPVSEDLLGPGQKPHASPSVRKFARELGVDLTRVTGSGPKGRIVHEDVQGYVKGIVGTVQAGGAERASTGGAMPASLAASGFGKNFPAWPSLDFSKFGPTEVQPLSRIKKISGPNLARNWAVIPHVTQFDEADITDLEDFRKSTNDALAKAGVKVTMLAFVMKACVAALQKYPAFASSLDANGENLILKKYFHIGFAADTPNGLVVPVLKDCDKKGVAQIAKETAELAGKARDGKLSPADMSGATFTISSLGGVGGTAFTPIINAPEVAILGLSKSDIKPKWDGKAFQPRLMLPLSLSYDHRVIDGAMAARFTTYLAEVLADMRRVLL